MGNCARCARRPTPAAVFLEDTIKKIQTRGPQRFTDYCGRDFIVTCSQNRVLYFTIAHNGNCWRSLFVGNQYAFEIERVMLDGRRSWSHVIMACIMESGHGTKRTREEEQLSHINDVHMVARDYLLHEAKTHALYRMFFDANDFMIPPK